MFNWLASWWHKRTVRTQLRKGEWIYSPRQNCNVRKRIGSEKHLFGGRGCYYIDYQCPTCHTTLSDGPCGGAAVNAVCKTCRINYGCLDGFDCPILESTLLRLLTTEPDKKPDKNKA
jgi:hypothetical protein